MKKDKSLVTSKIKMSSTLTDANLEQKFQTASNTQDSIQTLSLWLLHHKAHHQKIVSSWMKVLQKAKISHRLTLFYLANDVVQNSKRKNFQHFVNSFAAVLREATLLVRNDSIRSQIQRVFAIWEERNVYTSEFIADLKAILANTKVPATAPSKLLAQFKPDIVIEKIRSITKLDIEVNKKMTNINLSKLKATDAEIVQHFKDRIHGQQFKREFDDNVSRLEELIKLIEKEMADRAELILLLEQSEIYYDTQKGEAKIVANAYKNFGGRIEKLQKKLEEMSTNLPSPLPSPSLDAPSPTTSDQELELNLPSDNQEKGMTSWLDAFAQKKESLKTLSGTSEIKNEGGGSLESRLSSLIQNMPSLPAGLQNSLFNSNSSNNLSTNDTSSSSVIIKKEKGVEPSISAHANIKEDYSGQNTPLQDEDTHSSHAFFSKLASSNKTHSPKDILKGLTNLIQSASAEKEDNQKKEKFSSLSSSDIFEPQTGMTSFIKTIIPAISKSPQISSSPSLFFNTSQAIFTTSNDTSSDNVSSVNSYQSTFDNIPAFSTCATDQNEQRLFIPSLVPSTPLENIGFTQASFSTDEYNPEMEIFDTDMDIDNEDGSNLDAPSPDHEPLSSVAIDSVSEPVDIPRSITGRRLSTLITLVTDESPEQSLPKNQFISDDNYRSDKENFTGVPPWLDSSNNVSSVSDPISTSVISENSPKQDYFVNKQSEPSPTNSYTSAPPQPLPSVISTSNGQNNTFVNSITSPSETELSRIETVQSHRGNVNGRWFNDNNWSENHRNNFSRPPTPHHGALDGQFFNNRNFHSRSFQSHQNWSPRNRLDQPFQQKRNHPFSPRPYGPPPPNKRFPFRGRGGWGRNMQY